MANRTNAPLVSQIVEVDATLSLEPFIATANALVDWLESQDTANKLSDSMLAIIEMWLSAHFYSQRDKQYQQQATGRANATYQGRADMGLAGTSYGLQALALDVTGYLAQRNQEAITGNRRSARVYHLGCSDYKDDTNAYNDGPAP